jgi:hypothetical protein
MTLEGGWEDIHSVMLQQSLQTRRCILTRLSLIEATLWRHRVFVPRSYGLFLLCRVSTPGKYLRSSSSIVYPCERRDQFAWQVQVFALGQIPQYAF